MKRFCEHNLAAGLIVLVLFASVIFSGHGAGKVRAQTTQQGGGNTGSTASEERPCPDRPPLKTVFQEPNDPKKINHIAEARLEDGQRLIYINNQLWEPLSEAVKDFIYNHEYGHHALGHAKDLAAAGGILDPHTNRKNEVEADCYAVHTFAARQISGQLKEVEAFIDTLPASEHWRKDNFRKCLDNTMYRAQGPADANAQSYFILDKSMPIFAPCGDPAVLLYDIVYRNGGKVTLQCEVTVASGHRLRTAPRHDDSTWRPFETVTYKFTLPPNDRTRMRGYLTWYRVKETMPNIRIPRPDENPEYVRCTFAPGAVPPPKPYTLDFKAALPKLIEASREGFTSLFGPLAQEDRKYKALLALPEAEECTVQIRNGNEPVYDCWLKGTNDRQAVDKQYQEIVKKIKAWLPEDWKAEESLDSHDEKTFDAGLKDDERGRDANINVRLVKWGDSVSSTRGKYQLSVTFSGEWGGDLKPSSR